MCVVIAKYFDNKGWIGVKNRDRNYTPHLRFEIKTSKGDEQLLMHDTMTGYMEGINHHGVGVLSASLMVQDDEKEVTKSHTEHSPDGKRISKALLESDATSAAKRCIENRLTGNNIIFDRETLYLLEACLKDNQYHYVIKKIPHDATVARTNHGVWLPWAGYQAVEGDDNQTASRLSSEARLLQAEHVVQSARNSEELIDKMCKVYVNNPAMNIMRHQSGNKKMRTTAQEMIIPSERTLYCRPISSHIEFDFWQLNKPERNCWVEILSNRALWQDTKDDPPFHARGMKHD
jgi:hypothetical protein